MKAINIKWDISDEDVDDDKRTPDSIGLPSEIEIPDNIKDDEDAISDYISDETGYCHCRFELTES